MTWPPKTHRLQVFYNEFDDILNVEGLNYSGDLFRLLAMSKLGSIFKIVSRYQGKVELERLEPDMFNDLRGLLVTMQGILGADPREEWTWMREEVQRLLKDLDKFKEA